jgi:hypothetical protein
MNLAKFPPLNETTTGKEANFYSWWGRLAYGTVSICSIVGMPKPTEHRSRRARHRHGMDGRVV